MDQIISETAQLNFPPAAISGSELQHDHESARPHMRCGYGACTFSGCNCPGFTGNQNLCGNCGHNYSYH